MQDILKLLAKVRRFTGAAFTPSNGYDARKPLNFGQRMAVIKYARKIDQLTTGDFVVYKPKRGEKTEAFSYTGQKGYSKFNVAIVPKLNKDAKLTFEIDKRLPKGGRFVVTNKTSGQKFLHIDGKTIVAAIQAAEDEGIAPEDALYDLFSERMGEATFFLIQAGDGYMWGSSGGLQQIIDKILLILNTYGSNLFAKNSMSHWAQWFHGVTGFTRRQEVIPRIGEALRKRREWRERWQHVIPIPEDGSKWRRLTGGQYKPTRRYYFIARFLNGEMVPGSVRQIWTVR